MSINDYPLIAWGTAADLSTWTQSGTCSVTSGQADPFGGTSAYLLTDGSAGTVGSRSLAYTAAYAGFHVFTVAVKQSASNTPSSIWIDNITGSARGQSVLSWSAGVPTATNGGTGGGGFAPVAITSATSPTGWYLARCYVYASVGQSMSVAISPGDLNVVGTTNANLFYVRNLCLLDHPDSVMAWETPREGSSWVQGGSGVEDAWIQGTDFHYAAAIGWVPQLDRDTPVSVSGWNGPLETTGVNCGVSAMLRAGRNKEVLTYYADRSFGLQYSTAYGVDSYLVGPMGEAPTVEPNGDRRFTLELRNATKPYKPFETT